MKKIEQLTTEKEWLEAFRVLRQLRPHLTEETFLELVRLAEEKEGYRISVLRADGKIVSVIGYMPMITLYYGRFVWVCDLVTDAEERSKGYGEELLAAIEAGAKAEGYEGIALSSGLQRKDAHRFYEEKMNFEKASYAFRKNF